MPVDLKTKKRNRDDLLILASILPSDIDSAVITWNQLTQRGYGGILSATAATPGAAPAGKIWFNPDQAQFHHGTRGAIDPAHVRGALNRFNFKHGKQLDALAGLVADKQLTVSHWEAAMVRAIKDAQIANAAIGRGGVNQLTKADLEKIQERVVFQINRLNLFSGQVDQGAVAEEDLKRRASAYAESAITTYSDMRRRAAEVANLTLERNILHAAEHCRSGPGDPRPDCPSQTEMGWVPLGELTPIGERMCLWHCRCEIRFRRG